MTRFFLVVSLFLLASAGLSAQDRVKPYPIFRTAAWRDAVEAETRTESGAPGAKYWTDAARYLIKAELDPASAKLRGHIEMTYENRSPKPLRRLAIHLRKNLHKEGVTRDRPVEVTGGVDVENVTLDGTEIKPSWRRGYSIRGTIMSVRLREPLEPGAKTTIAMDWSYHVAPSGGAPRTGHEDHHVFYLGYWYPQFAVRDDVRDWVAEPYLGNGEFYMGYADYDLEFTVPHGFIVRATGDHTNRNEVLPRKIRARLKKLHEQREVVRVVTADDLGPGRATVTSESGKLTWKFVAQQVRDIAVSTSDRYLWDATHAVVPNRDGPGKDGRTEIHAVYEAEAPSWKRAAEFARHAIEFNSKSLMPYPWPHMTACEGVSGGGMEFPMMTIISVGPSARGLQSVIAHELIHMWFPMIAGSDEKTWAWMDEGTTDYLTSVTDADFWNSPRTIRQIPLGYVRLPKRNPDLEVEVMRHADRFPANTPAYGFASYAKTAAVLFQLRGILGSEVFEEALRTYVREWAYKHPYPYDLFNTFERVSGRNLEWYFRVWLYETWTLDWAVENVETSDVATTVTIKDLGLAPGPAVVEARYADGSSERKIVPAKHWLDGARQATLEFGPNVERVTIDPDRASLDLNRRNNRWPRRRSR